MKKMRSYGPKPRALPLVQLKEKLLYESVRRLARVLKLVKGLLIQKICKKIKNPGDKDGNGLEKLAVWLEEVKHTDHKEIARKIAEECLSLCKDSKSYNVSNGDNPIYKQFLGHRRIKELINDIELKIAVALSKNNLLRAKEDKEAARSANPARMLKKRIIGMVCVISCVKFIN